MKKRILSMVLCLSLFVATFATTMVVSAADDIREDGYCAEIKDYREEGNLTAPTKEGKVFAGWYTDGTFKTAIDPSVTEGEAWAKFVDPTVFTIQNQFNTGAHKTSATVDLRIITTIDSEWYAGIEFTFTCEDFGSKTFPIDTVYTSLVNYDSAKEQFCNDSEYFAVEKITGIPAEAYTKKMSITPIFTTYDGTVITGTTRGTEAEPLVLKDKLPLGTTTFDVNHAWMQGLGWTNPIYINASILNEIGHGVTCYPSWEQGGIYVDNVKTNATIVKHNDYGYYIPLDSLYDEMTVTIQGTFTYDGCKVIVAPVTFKFDVEDTADTAEGSWTVVSREALEIETVKLTVNAASCDDKAIFFTTNAPDAIGYSGVLDTFTYEEGGIYVDYVKQPGAYLVKYGHTNYYIGLHNVGAAKVGTCVTIQGIVKANGQKVRFQATTFKYKGNNVWEIISNKYVEEMAVRKPAGLMGQTEQSTIWFYNNNIDELEYSATGTLYRTWEEGGIYLNNELVQVDMVHFSNQEYYVAFGWANIEIKENDRVMIRGVLSDGTNKVRFHQEKAFVFVNGAWTQE